ncbi:MAG: glycosyltransferase family 2 protein [Promethearchaeota archaeon]
MYRSLKVAVVVPARNEERLIGRTIWPVPDSVDTIYVVDDGSQDGTAEVVRHYADNDSRIRLIRHRKNKGVGAAIITGYHQAYRDGHDVFVVVGGDAQMDWTDLSNLLRPIADGSADYSKGNRFIYGESKDSPGNAWREMPTRRILGNVSLSILTKIASGYYHIYDSQMGYTALHRRVFPLVNWENARKGYGYPADWLMRFHSNGVRVQDVPVRAIYLKNERQTQIRVRRFLFYMMGIIVKGGLERINREYLAGRLTLPRISIPSIISPLRSLYRYVSLKIGGLNLSNQISRARGARVAFENALTTAKKSSITRTLRASLGTSHSPPPNRTISMSYKSAPQGPTVGAEINEIPWRFALGNPLEFEPKNTLLTRLERLDEMLTALPREAAKKLNLKEHTDTLWRSVKKLVNGEEASGTA